MIGEFGFRPPQSPVEEGKEYECEIEDLGREGDGMTRINNFVVFVPNTTVGQKVKIKIVRVMRRVAFGEVVSEGGEAEPPAEEEPAEEAPAEEPAEEPTEEPAEEEPAEEAPAEEPAEEPTEEPAEEKPAEEPAEETPPKK
ncbi:MAG: TRAM domain-containing protein [Thermoplasmata archaeon]